LTVRVQPPSLLEVFSAAERRLSPRVEAWVRTDAFLDLVAVANSVSSRGGRSLEGTIARAVETLGFPSARQVRALQRSLDEMIGVARSATEGSDAGARKVD
jgi:hypothetical protein